MNAILLDRPALFSIAITLLLSCIPPLQAEEKIAAQDIKPSAAESKIRETIALHFEGIRTGKIELLQQAWDVQNGHLKQVRSGKIISQPIEKSFAHWASNPDQKTKGEILSVDIVGVQMAVVRVDLKWHGGKFTDLLTLLKSKSGWKIVEKSYISKNAEFRYYSLSDES